MYNTGINFSHEFSKQPPKNKFSDIINCCKSGVKVLALLSLKSLVFAYNNNQYHNKNSSTSWHY